MKRKSVIFAIIFVIAVLNLCGQSGAATPKKIYHWPYLKLSPYTSLQYNYMSNGDIDDRRAFYWGRVIGSDGLMCSIRGLLPHIIEGNWQEKVYNNSTEKTFIFDKVKDFQDTYAAYGCDDNYMQFHTHPPLYGEGVTQWRADVIAGMTQKAELMAYAGINRILIDMEFASQDTVSTDPQFWYDLGGDIITAMRTENTDFKFGFYPGLHDYWVYVLTASERTNPRSIGTYPGQSSIPEGKRNMRHALVEGIYNSLNGTTMWHFPGTTYSPSHLCAASSSHTYVFNLEEILNNIINGHTAMIGPGIEYMPVKWDFGRTQTAPIGNHWKQPNQSLLMTQRNYNLIYQYTDYAGTWDHGTTWDDDGPNYLIYNSIPDFINVIDDITVEDEDVEPHIFAFKSGYRYDTVTGQIHNKSVPVEASTSERLNYFVFYGGPQGYHITGKQPDNFPDYVDTMIVAAGKDKITIPLRDSTEYGWADEYKQKGFFKRQALVRTPNDPVNYGYLLPAQCNVFDDSDLNEDCVTNLIDLTFLATRWLEDDSPGDGCDEMGDVNNDCSVNIEDVKTMAGEWFAESNSYSMVVANYSFEEDNIADGQTSAAADVPEWLNNSYGNIYVFDPSDAQWQTRYNPGETIPEGEQVLWLNDLSGRVRQVLAETVQANTLYTLNAEVGAIIDAGNSWAEFKLVAVNGATYITLLDVNLYENSDPTGQGTRLVQGQWVPQTLQFNSSDFPAAAGLPFRMVLKGQYVDMDNITLQKSQ